MLTVGELFAGIGGFSLAFHAAGARTAWFVEKEPFCQRVLQKNFPGVPVYGDIYECHDLPYVDVITAGFPCQPFSLAGKRQGVNDERYLVPEMFRVIEEAQPRAVVLENVPGFTNIAAGDTFNQLLRALAALGYDAQWGHIRASDLSAPHQRERWFCVAYRTGDEGHLRLQLGSDRRAHEAKQTGLGYPALGNPAYNTGFDLPGKRRNIPQAGRKTTRANAAASSRGRTRSKVECRLGGAAHGLSCRLDRPLWPARPGEPQHAWEPPRVVSGQPNRTARLKALGNAVVPQVVYPIACEIVTWLEAQASEESEVA